MNIKVIEKPLCVFQAPFLTRSGYGDWSLLLAKILYKSKKFNMKFVPTRWGDCQNRNIDNEVKKDPIVGDILNNILKDPLDKFPEVFMQVTIPNEFLIVDPQQPPKRLAKFCIGLTASIETTVPSHEWIEGVNRMDLTIVLSEFGKKVLEDCKYVIKNNIDISTPNQELKIQKPIEVVFWGADTKLFNTTRKCESRLVNEELNSLPEDFLFLFVGQWTGNNFNSDRKGIGHLIKIFLNTFAGEKNMPALVLKTNGASFSRMDKHDCLVKIRDVTNWTKDMNVFLKEKKLPNVYLLHGELTEEEMADLLAHEKVKAHVSTTRGEGFGHPLLLASLSGKPVMAPKWSGHLDFLNSEYSVLFDGSLEPLQKEALNQWFIDGAKWFIVNENDVTLKLRDVYYHYDSYLEKAKKLAEINKEKFSVEAMENVLFKVLETYENNFSQQVELKLPKLKKIELTDSKKI